MSITTASIEGLGKKGDLYSFLINVPSSLNSALKSGMSIKVNDQDVTIKDFDGEYLSFELPLDRVVDTSLAELEIGSEVKLRFI